MISQLTKTERLLALVISVFVAFVGLLMAGAGRADPLGAHGFVVLGFGIATAFVIISGYHAPEPAKERLAQYYDDPVNNPIRLGKAPIDTPRRAMGDLLGHAVRFGVAGEVMAAGEGIETMLSLRMALPDMPMVAALSAAHLSVILFADTLRRLYIARDDDPAGDCAMAALIECASADSIEAIVISPKLADFNENLRMLGPDALRAALRAQMSSRDAARFMAEAA